MIQMLDFIYGVRGAAKSGQRENLREDLKKKPLFEICLRAAGREVVLKVFFKVSLQGDLSRLAATSGQFLVNSWKMRRDAAVEAHRSLLVDLLSACGSASNI